MFPEDRSILVTFSMPAIKDEKICTESKFDHFSPDSNVVNAAVSLSGTDRLIVGTFLFPILPLIPFVGHLLDSYKEDPEKGENPRAPDTGFCGTCQYFW